MSWPQFVDTPAYYAWRGNAFEVACVCHEEQLKHAIGISAVQCECFPWKSTQADPGVQIDLVINRADRVTDICEMKYTDSEFSIDKDYEDELKRKVHVFKEESRTKNAVRLVMVCANGLKPNTHSWDVATTISSKDLFAF